MIKTLQERFETLSRREKLMTLAALAAVLWGGCNTLIIQPNLELQKQLHQELSGLQIQIDTNRKAAEQIELRGKMDPDQANRDKLANLRAQLTQRQSQLNQGSKTFVAPEGMAETLHHILRQHDLKLIKLETVPVTTMTQSENQAWVYRHGLTITFNGSYLATLDYLKALESQPWHFYWESLLYQVKKHPMAEVTITIYTLSFEENWLSV